MVCGPTPWDFQASGEYLISSSVLASPAASVTFSSIAGTFNHLRLVCIGRSSQSTIDSFTVQFNGDTAAHYDWMGGASNTGGIVQAYGAAVTSVLSTAYRDLPGTNATSGVPGRFTMEIPIYSQTTFEKTGTVENGYYDAVGSAGYWVNWGWVWRSTAAITSIVVAPLSGSNFVTGSAFYLYGIN